MTYLVTLKFYQVVNKQICKAKTIKSEKVLKSFSQIKSIKKFQSIALQRTQGNYFDRRYNIDFKLEPREVVSARRQKLSNQKISYDKYSNMLKKSVLFEMST